MSQHPDAPGEPHDLPLRCVYVDGVLSFQVGVNTIKWAVEHHPELVDAEHYPGLESPVTVNNPDVFAAELARKINDESEDGSTMLTDMLDKAIMEAIADGADGVRFVNDDDM